MPRCAERAVEDRDGGAAPCIPEGWPSGCPVGSAYGVVAVRGIGKRGLKGL